LVALVARVVDLQNRPAAAGNVVRAGDGFGE
jgi:hypothetical protein